MTTANNIPAGGTFQYVAQTFDGKPMTGTIDAIDLEDAARRLTNLSLRIIRLDPAQRPPARAKPLSGEDFAAFNQQLAHLSAAGLPIEQGLRLIAEDLRHGGLAQSVREVSEELERGVPLGEAFKRHERQFPPLYGTLIDAGVRAGNLPAVLLNLGRHLELVARLRAAVWRSASYPLTVVAGLLLILVFLGRYVLPGFAEMYRHWYTPLPGITRFVFMLAQWMPIFLVLMLLIVLGLPLLWTVLRATRLDRTAADAAVHLPLLGPILRRNLIARWCDAMKLAVQAGMDLPAAVQLASDVVGSGKLQRDGQKIVTQLQSGAELDQENLRLSILPRPVLAVIQLSSDRSDLPTSLETMATMYQQQAEMRLASLQTVLTPTLILAVAVMVGVVILGLFAPMISMFRYFS
jgi:type IV pilus assembly protein PilC